MDRNRHLGSTPSFDPGPLFLDRGSIIEERFEHRGSDRVRARVGAWVSKK